jgi:hypothetical protein
MPALYEIRADYDKNTITLYQAYSRAIALPALEHQHFVSPFSLNRMTRIKPSFLPKERVYPLDPNIAHRLGMV